MRLVTHNGRFHYDELLSSSMLLKIYPGATITRTRDESVIMEGDIVYDVGGVFDPVTKRFDHHQATFFETFSPKYSIKMSSSGLVFKHFHMELLCLYGISPYNGVYDTVVDKAYSEFFLHADAIDNGYDIYGEIRPRNITDVISLFNPVDASLEEEKFYEALRITSCDLDNYMNYLRSWTDGYEYVMEKIRNTEGHVLILDKHYSTSLVLEIESKYNKSFKYMIFPHNDLYKIIAIPKAKGSFETKSPLKKEWCGLRDQELSRTSEIDGCIFVHASGFMGINRTLEGALKMCEDSIV